MKESHELFIDHVKKHRGAAIKIPEADRESIIYNAEVFNGDDAVKLG